MTGLIVSPALALPGGLCQERQLNKPPADCHCPSGFHSPVERLANRVAAFSPSKLLVCEPNRIGSFSRLCHTLLCPHGGFVPDTSPEGRSWVPGPHRIVFVIGVSCSSSAVVTPAPTATPLPPSPSLSPTERLVRIQRSGQRQTGLRGLTPLSGEAGS